MKKSIIISVLILITGIVNAQTQQPKNDTTYVIKCKAQELQLLYLAVTSPKDVTPNQVEYLQKLIAAYKPEADSVKVKK